MADLTWLESRLMRDRGVSQRSAQSNFVYHEAARHRFEKLNGPTFILKGYLKLSLVTCPVAKTPAPRMDTLTREQATESKAFTWMPKPEERLTRMI
jgi:hypothetical protein